MGEGTTTVGQEVDLWVLEARERGLPFGVMGFLDLNSGDGYTTLNILQMTELSTLGSGPRWMLLTEELQDLPSPVCPKHHHWARPHCGVLSFLLGSSEESMAQHALSTPCVLTLAQST